MSQHKLRYSEIWDRINVEAFEEAIGFEPIDDRNGNDIGYCVWPDNHNHGDTTGKFGIHREKRVYNCWSCGGGSLLSLVMELYAYDVDEATEYLAQFCEEDMRSDNEFVDEFLSAFEDTQRRVETLPYFNARVLDKFDEPVPDWWLDERQIDIETAQLYGLRYSSEVRRPSPVKGRFAGEPEYHGPAIVFPHYWQDRLVGWQSRWLDDDRPEWIPKYTNTGDFPRETTVYGWDQFLQSGHAGPVILVESSPSVLFLVSHDQASLGTFGSGINEPQLRILRRCKGGVILARDNDKTKEKAGVKWCNTLTNYLKRYIPVWHLPPIEGKPGADVGDIASFEDPYSALQDYLSQAYEPGIDL